MKIKALEIRDKGTFIPVIAILLVPENERQRYLLRRCGLGSTGSYRIALLKLTSGHSQMDPEEWRGRTMPLAHEWIDEHFDELADGAVVDVEFILGETKEPKPSEAFK